MRTILVTGGCGYLGSQLIRDLAQLAPVTVRILDNLRPGQLRALMDLPDVARYEFVEGDILDPQVLRLALRDVEAVVHLAAIVRTPLTFDNPAWLQQVNRWGTAHLVEEALQAGVTRVVFTSTAAVYGPNGPHDELSPCRPQGPYAQSKLAAEQSILAAASRGLRPTILRVGILYGLAPVTRYDAVANRFAMQAGTRQAITIYGDGAQRRPLVHVRDASAAVLLALTQQLDAPIYNVVSDNVSVLDLAELAQACVPGARIRFTEQDIRTRVTFSVDATRLTAAGWRAAWTPAAGLAEIASHFRSLHPFHLATDDRADVEDE